MPRSMRPAVRRCLEDANRGALIRVLRVFEGERRHQLRIVEECVGRGWMLVNGREARITEAGREVIGGR